METDSNRNRWDRKYLNRENHVDLEPDPLLVEHANLFRKFDVVVDVACGAGRHSMFLAGIGCFVIALDYSRQALRRCNELAVESNSRIHAVAADLSVFRFAPHSLDAIVCFNYLNRELNDNLHAALKPGGVLVMKTFNHNYREVNPKFNPAYMLAPGELARMHGNLQMIMLDDECQPASKTKSAVIARKPIR